MPTTEASTSPTDGLTSAPATPPAPDGAYRRVALPDNVVATYVLDHDLGADLSVHRLASWGTIVVFDAFNHEFERDLHLVDLTHPAVQVVARAPAGDVDWTPDISGHRLVWTEYHFDRPGSDAQGSSTWRILALDLDTGASMEVAHGVHSRLTAGSAAPAVAHVDGDLVAYGVQDARPEAPDGWSIIVRSLVSGEITRTIETAEDLYRFDLAAGNVVYSEGKTDPDADFKYATRLMISTVANPAPIEIARDAYEVSAGDGRFAWVSDPKAGADRSPLPEQPIVMTAAFDDARAVQASVLTQGPPPPPDWGPPLLGALFPATSDGYVGWQDRQTDGQWDGEIDRVGIWDGSTGLAYKLDGAVDPVEVHLGGGWLTWNSDINPEHSDLTHVLHGLDLASLSQLLR